MFLPYRARPNLPSESCPERVSRGLIHNILMMNEHNNMEQVLRDLAQALKALMQKVEEEDEGFYDNADLKSMLHISDRTLYRWRQQGLVRYAKMNGKFYYPKSTLRSIRKRMRGRS